ncbi:YgjV family protein [Azospirillum sp. ST 5-10]|uniref:YgjV family protein n=1 Tax=unclassified Azospirillum TaxID=2630922 RepID=UPI003F4A06CD
MTAFLLDYLSTNLLVSVTGLAALLIGTASTVMTDRRSILAAQAAGCLLFAFHYYGLGARTGMMMSGLCLMQMAAAYPAVRPRWCPALFLATVAAGFAVAAATWQGPMSALSATGFALGTLGRWQTRVRRMRVCFVVATVAGLGHDALAGAVFGLAAGVLGLSGNLVSLWRLTHPRLAPPRAA